jgi:serine phosphatase RsbU (regulator of sigma subunit)
MQTKIGVYTKFLLRETVQPMTVLTALFVGAAINMVQSRDIFYSAVPFIIPLMVQGVAIASMRYKNIDMDENSSRRELEFSLSAIMGFNREVMNSINELVKDNDIYDRLALLIIKEGYRGVFITRENQAGNLSGFVFKGKPDTLVRSELIVVSEKSSAPIWASRKAECDINACVISATNAESETQEAFENKHPFDERVKKFLGFEITNYINYAEGDVSIIAFNKRTGIRKSDAVVINAVVNTARSITHLIDLAIGNNRMLSAMELAEEVQQKLLPQRMPDIKGLDVAARVIYCDKAGGDYYDFPNTGNGSAGDLNVVVGDVAGHGIAAGLEMATARALIRSRSAEPGSLSQIVTDVNRNLALDTRKTGQFMTLFYLTVNPAQKRLCWVRAGHDAALVYNPSQDSFTELFGPGMALGVDERYRFEENELTHLMTGQLILIGTDGIWETRNTDGGMFGKQRVKDIMRRHAASSTDKILDEVLLALSQFRADAPPEDDITLVVLKIVADS